MMRKSLTSILFDFNLTLQNVELYNEGNCASNFFSEKSK